MKIYLNELPKIEYVPSRVTQKDRIVLHHTVSDSGKYVPDWFKDDKGKIKVAVAYIIEKDGTVVQLFDPEFWAWHIGGKSKYKENAMSVGIELVNEGVLFKRENGDFYWWIDSENPKGKVKYLGEVHEEKDGWRGYNYFAKYSKEQMAALKELTEFLLNKFPLIPTNCIDNFDYVRGNMWRKGIVMHCNLVDNKTDLSPAFDLKGFNKFIEKIAIEELEVKEPEFIPYPEEKIKKAEKKTSLEETKTVKKPEIIKEIAKKEIDRKELDNNDEIKFSGMKPPPKM